MDRIQWSSEVPDSTYFRRGDCEPIINEDGTLTVYDGEGTRRSSWGAPGVTSTIVVDAPDFLAVHVSFYHKHRGGQFWRYYYLNGDVERKSWGELPDETREIVLDAYAEKGQVWWNVPGKLRKDYIKPDPKANLFTGYKIVSLEDNGTLRGLYDSAVLYEIGKTRIEKARPNHGGGFYTYLDGESIIERYKAGEIIGTPKPGRRAVLRCECWGQRYCYDEAGRMADPYDVRWLGESFWNKVASTYCKPVEIVTEFEIA